MRLQNQLSAECHQDVINAARFSRYLTTKKTLINKIEHLGIAVSSIEEGEKIFADLLGSQPYKRESVESEKVTTSFFMLGQSKVELLEATDPESPIRKFIDKRGGGIHHIALDVTDIEMELERLQGLGFQLIHQVPKAGADNKKIAFLHPKSTAGVLIELCEDINSESNHHE